MRVLHVIPSFAPAWRYGGPIYASLGLTRELVRQGHQVTVMTTNKDGAGVLDVDVEHPVMLDGVEVCYFPIQAPRQWYFSRPMSVALHRRVRSFDIVHIHSLFLWPTTAASSSAYQNGIPYIVRPAGLLDPVCMDKEYEGRRRWVSLVKKRVHMATLGARELQRASGIHFTSADEMRVSRLPPNAAPGFVVPLGVDLPSLNTNASWLCDEYPQLREKKIVLFLSRIDRKKGLELLITAMNSVLRRHSDVRLVIAGMGEKSYENEIKRRLQWSGIADQTFVVGHVNGQQKWDLLRRASVFVLPSYHENFGTSVVEAMASATPVLISSAVNIQDQVRYANAGMVIDLESHAIERALDHLLTDEQASLEMGRNGRRLVSERFRWDKVAMELVNVYEKIVRKNESVLANCSN